MQNPLRTLARESRDSLFLLAVIAWIIAPQINHLPLWCIAMAAGVLAWRAWLAWHASPLPRRPWLVALLLLSILGTYWSHKTLLGRDAGVTFAVVLLTLKTLEMRAQRDAFVIFFLGFFTLLSNFFYSQNLLVAASMLLGVLGLLTAIVNSHMPVGKPALRVAARTAGWMALLGTPIMVVLFLLFPRIAPLWGLPADAMNGRSGLSSSMEVGTIAELALDDSIAMRVRFEGAPPRQSELYFRGPVLSTFNGRQWTPLRSTMPASMQLPPNLAVRGEGVRYQITLEGNHRSWLLTLDATPSKPELTGFTPSMTPDLQWVVDRPLNDLVRYRAHSYTDFSHGPQRNVAGLRDYLDLPAGLNPRTRQLAIDMRRDDRWAGADDPTLVAAVLDRLRTGGYSYTLEPGLYGTHTADEFWFDRKQGFCEHIASSFVLLMRAMDIPARVVTGYQGGELNAVDGFWTVRQSDAHAWAEVWLAGQGWVRVDPTTAVAPGRTGSVQRLSAPANVFTQAMRTVSPAFVLNLRTVWDALNNRWNQWVLNYSQTRQIDMLRNLGFESPSWEDLLYLLIALTVALSLLAAAWTVWERSRQDPWLRLLHMATYRLRAAGFKVEDNAPPRRLAALLQNLPPHERPPLESTIAWLVRLETWRYAAPDSPTRTKDTIATLKRDARPLHWPAKRSSIASRIL